MNVQIDIEATENEIKNEKCSNGKWNKNKIELNQISAWVSALQHRNRNCSNENEIKNDI